MSETTDTSCCNSVCPIMPTTDVARTVHFYRAMGFAVDVRGDFIMTKRDTMELFLSINPEHAPKHTAACIYIRLDDADALHAHWQADGVGAVRESRNTDYKMREFAVTLYRRSFTGDRIEMTSHQTALRRGSAVRSLVNLGLGQAATTLLTILLTIKLARALGPAEFGLLYLLVSIAGFAYVVVDWGHPAFIIRETARRPDRAGNLLGSAMVLRSVAALIVCVVAVGMTWLLGYDLRTRLLTGAVIVALLPQSLGLSFCWVFRGHQWMGRDALLNVTFRIAVFISSIACLALGGRVPGLILASLLAGCLTFAIGISMYRRLQLPTISATMSTARELLSDGVPLLAISLAVAVEPFLNANILYKLAPTAVVGWYGAASSITGTLIGPATIIAGAMYPRFSIAARDTGEFTDIFHTAFRSILIVSVLAAVGTYLFADVAIGLIYSAQKFGPASDNLRAFAPLMLLIYIDVLLTTVILATGRTNYLAAIKIATVAITTGLVFLLIPFCQARYANGGLGVLYAMTIGELPMLVAACRLVPEAVNGRTIADLCRSLIAGAATILLMRALPALSPVLTIPMCVLVFGALALLVGAVKRSDIALLLASYRRRSPISEGAADGLAPTPAIDPSSPHRPVGGR